MHGPDLRAVSRRRTLGARSAATLAFAGAGAVLVAMALEFPAPGSHAATVTLSAAAAEGPHAALLSVTQLAYAAGLFLLAPVAHRTLPGTSPAGPVALAVGGACGVLLVAFRCGHACLADGLAATEAVHIGAVGVGAATTVLAPVLVARRVRPYPAWRRYARCSMAAAVAVLASLVAWGLTDGSAVDGAVERGAVAVAAAWLGMTAGRLLVVSSAGRARQLVDRLQRNRFRTRVAYRGEEAA